MTVFKKYADYYNLIYRDKDYERESGHLGTLLKKYAPDAKAVLELGCGTGIHAAFLAKGGYKVCGIDCSEEMLSKAEELREGLSLSEAENLHFTRDDIRNFRNGRKFDAVVSLFHVMSYQMTNEDLIKTFETARSHLDEGGIFFFDCWYGPSVLSEGPSVRIKRLENDATELTRIAEPTMFPGENRVDVNYHVFIRDKIDDSYEEIKEVHKMRYLFVPEVSSLFESHGMEMIYSGEWLTGRKPAFDTWSVCFGGRVR